MALTHVNTELMVIIDSNSWASNGFLKFGRMPISTAVVEPAVSCWAHITQIVGATGLDCVFATNRNILNQMCLSESEGSVKIAFSAVFIILSR